MSDKMPEMTEEAVREWVWELAGRGEGHLARAVLALVEAKVREAVTLARPAMPENGADAARVEAVDAAIVARVLGRDGGAR